MDNPEYTEEQLRALTPWERFLLTKKPIIAPDGYIPNSVVRRQIGFTKPESPQLPWQLKPVPDADPRHMPDGWKPKKEESRNSFDGSKSADEDVNLDSIMSMKRATTIQNVKVQQNMKEASLFIGMAMCLLPDGTEPEGIPNFAWKSEKEEVADLSPLARPRPEDFTPVKEINVITPIPVKVTPDGTSPAENKFEFKSQTKALKKVDIDIGGGLSLDIGTRPPIRVGKMPPPLEVEKTKSFRLSQATSLAPMEPPLEESEKGTEDGASNPSPVPTEASTTAGASSTKQENKKTKKPDVKKENSKAEARIPRAGTRKNPIAAPPQKKLNKEEELTLLQKIVKEEWFPPGVPPLLDLVNDELTKLIDTTDSKVFTQVCDYIVQIFQELSIAPKFLNRAGDKLSKQLTSPSAIIRKKALWTIKQLGISTKKNVVSSLLPNLMTAKEETREELISTLSEMLGGSNAKEGLTSLMSSLGINNKPLGTKEEQQAAIKAISEKLQSEAERLKSASGTGEAMKQRMEMWVSSLNLPQDPSMLKSHGTSSRPLDSTLGSRGESGFETEPSFDRQSTKSDVRRQRSRGGAKTRGKTKRKGRRKSSTSKAADGGESDEVMSVTASVQTDPYSDDDMKDRRRGRWRRGGMSEFRDAGDGDDYSDIDDEEEGDDIDKVYEKGEDGQPVKTDDGFLRTESGLFTAIDYDFTPNMFRSETGGSEWSDDVPPLANTTPGRPKGASVHKFYERRDHVATVVSQDPARAYGAYPPSDSLYDQGRPRLSPIKSQSNLNKPKEEKEPEWKDFFESTVVQEKRKAGTDYQVHKDLQETQPLRIPMLPPIMYVDPEQPTLPGEAGLRLLHSIRLADKERTTVPVGRLVEALPGRLTITTHDEPNGDTNYGLLQMHWTTQVPFMVQAGLHTERQTTNVHRDDMLNTNCSEPPAEKQALPRLHRADTNVNKAVPKMTTANRERTLPVLNARERSDFQWSMPMAPAPKRQSLMNAAGIQHYEEHCQHYKWATKKMHHYISSSKDVHLPKMEPRAQSFLSKSLNNDLMSVVNRSSVALMPSMSTTLEKLFKGLSPSS